MPVIGSSCMTTGDDESVEDDAKLTDALRNRAGTARRSTSNVRDPGVLAKPLGIAASRPA